MCCAFYYRLPARTDGGAEVPLEPPDPPAIVRKPEAHGSERLRRCAEIDVSPAEFAARANNLPIEFFTRVIWQESRFRADAIGPMTYTGKRALGIAQFMPGQRLNGTCSTRSIPYRRYRSLPSSCATCAGNLAILGLLLRPTTPARDASANWMAGSGPMPSETRAYVHAITGASVEQWAKRGDDDSSQGSGRGCGELMALLKRAPNVFLAALEQRVIEGAKQPWGVILGADMSHSGILARYAALQQRHAAVLAGRDPILLERGRGPLPRYQVRIGADTRAAANELCNRILKDGGICVVLGNPRS